MSELVLDASVLILLAKAKALHLVTETFDHVTVPAAVAAEVLAGPTGDPAKVLIEQRMFAPYPASTAADSFDPRRRGAGERAVIALGIERSCVVALDDKSARHAADSAGLVVVGTLGLLARAASRGVEPEPLLVLQRLVISGLRISQPLLLAVVGQLSGRPGNTGEEEEASG